MTFFVPNNLFRFSCQFKVKLHILRLNFVPNGFAQVCQISNTSSSKDTHTLPPRDKSLSPIDLIFSEEHVNSTATWI